MTCALITDIIDLYLENRLIPSQARWVEAHAASCPECAAELKAWKLMKNSLKTLPAAAIPADFKAGLKAALAGTKAIQTGAAADDNPVVCSNDLPALTFAFSFLIFLITVSGSFFGPGIPSQACTDNTSSICAGNASNSVTTGD